MPSLPKGAILAVALTLPAMCIEGAYESTSAAQPRFAGQLADGARFEGAALRDWHAAGAAPHLDGQPLLAEGRPFAWVVDRAKMLARQSPAAYVEMHSGDVLPGVVREYRTGDELLYEPLAAHFVVEPRPALTPPAPAEDSRVRVLSSAVKRIVWNRRRDVRYRPREIFLRDGRSLAFRAARFKSETVELFVEGETRSFRFDDIAELHLPLADPWQAFLEELAVLSPDLSSRLLQLETTSGLKVTASLARFEPATIGDASQSSNWVHGLHPPWSLDLLWIPCGEACAWRSWSPLEAPLGRLAFEQRFTLQSFAASSFPAIVDRNVLGGPMRGRTLNFGAGIGVHSGSSLRIELRPFATGFRTLVGLDRQAGVGGCVKARALIDSTPLFESGFLIGAESLADTGQLTLPPSTNAGERTLRLEIDPASEGRPEGADGDNVRDIANWIDPKLTLDTSALRIELSRVNFPPLLARQGWRIFASGENVKRVNFRDEMTVSPGRFTLGLAHRGEAVTLHRMLTLRDDDRELIIGVSRPFDRGPAPRVEVRLDGEIAFEGEIPRRDRNSPQASPVVVSLRGYEKKRFAQPLSVEVRQLPQAEETPIRYGAIQTAPQSMRLFRVLEDDEAVKPTADSRGKIDWQVNDRQFGASALKVAAQGKATIEFTSPVAIRERPRYGEYRLLRLWFRKLGQGRLAFDFKSLGDDKIHSLFFGPGESMAPMALRMMDQPLPADWLPITRDLYGDLGTCDLQSLTIDAPDGEAALVDGVYFARDYDDLNLLPQQLPGDFCDTLKWPEVTKPGAERLAAATVKIELPGGGTFSGAVFDSEGHILTAGHVVLAPGKTASVRLADGRMVTAVTKGVCRDADLGVLKIVEAGPFPYVDLLFERNLAEAAPYVAIATDGSASAVTLRRMMPQAIWREGIADAANAQAIGSPLADAYGRLAGVAFRSAGEDFDPARGLVYARFPEGHEMIALMKNGEVWGAWRRRAGPMLGARFSEAKEGGLRVEEIDVRGPLAAAGLLAGDILEKLDGAPVSAAYRVEQMLAGKDPGQAATISYRRENSPREANVTVAPRIP